MLLCFQTMQVPVSVRMEWLITAHNFVPVALLMGRALMNVAVMMGMFQMKTTRTSVMVGTILLKSWHLWLLLYAYADIDECANILSHNCSEEENEICRNTNGSFTCDCMPGFEMSKDSQSCVGEMLRWPWSNLNLVTLLPWSLCTDIDECNRAMVTKMATQICSDNEMCLNTRGAFICQCNSGFSRSESGGSCKGKFLFLFGITTECDLM